MPDSPPTQQEPNPFLAGVAKVGGAVGHALMAVPNAIGGAYVGPTDNVAGPEVGRRIAAAILFGGNPGALATLQGEWAKQDQLTRAAAADPVIQKRIADLAPLLGPRAAFEQVRAETPSLKDYSPSYRKVGGNESAGLPSPASLMTSGRAGLFPAAQPAYEALARAKEQGVPELPPTSIDRFKLDLSQANDVANQYRRAGRKVTVQADSDGKAAVVVNDDSKRLILPANEIVKRGLLTPQGGGFTATPTETEGLYELKAPTDMTDFAKKEGIRAGIAYYQRTGDPSQIPADVRAQVLAGGGGASAPGGRVGTDALDLQKHAAQTAIDTRAKVESARQVTEQKDRGQLEGYLDALKGVQTQLDPLVDRAFPRFKTPASSGSAVIDALPDTYAIQQRARFAATKTTDDNAAQQVFAARAQHALSLLAHSLGMRPGPRASEQLEGSLYNPGDSAEQVHTRIQQLTGFREDQLRAVLSRAGYEADPNGIATMPSAAPATGAPADPSKMSTQELLDRAGKLGVQVQPPAGP